MNTYTYYIVEALVPTKHCNEVLFLEDPDDHSETDVEGNAHRFANAYDAEEAAKVWRAAMPHRTAVVISIYRIRPELTTIVGDNDE